MPIPEQCNWQCKFPNKVIGNANSPVRTHVKELIMLKYIQVNSSFWVKILDGAVNNDIVLFPQPHNCFLLASLLRRRQIHTHIAVYANNRQISLLKVRSYMTNTEQYYILFNAILQITVAKLRQAQEGDICLMNINDCMKLSLRISWKQLLLLLQ